MTETPGGTDLSRSVSLTRSPGAPDAPAADPQHAASEVVRLRITGPPFTDFFVYDEDKVDTMGAEVPADRAQALIEAAAEVGVTIEQEV